MTTLRYRLSNLSQSTQNLWSGLTGPSRSQSTSSATSSSSGATTPSTTADTKSIIPPYERPTAPRDTGASIPAPTAPELARVAALQNQRNNTLKQKYEAWKGNNEIVMPALVDVNALRTLGYVKTTKRSHEIVDFLHTAGVLSGRTMTLGPVAMDGLIKLSEQHLATHPLTDKEKHGVRVLVEGVQRNMYQISEKFLNVKVSQRPYALYYRGLTETLDESYNTMMQLKDFGVLDHEFKPVNGSLKFDNFKTQLIKNYTQRGSTEGEAQTLFESVHDYTEALRDTLFPLPGYEGSKPNR